MEPTKKTQTPYDIKRGMGMGDKKEIRTSEFEMGKKRKSFIRHRILKEQKKIHNEKDLNISLANAENVGDEKYSVFHGRGQH